MSITFEFTGGIELAKKLEELPNKMAKRYVVRALRAGAKPILAEVVANTPVGDEGRSTRYHIDGALKEGEHISTSTRNGEVTATVGNRREQYYAIMYDRGSRQPAKRTSVDQIKRAVLGAPIHQQPRPYMADALERTAGEATTVAAATLKQEIEAGENTLP